MSLRSTRQWMLITSVVWLASCASLTVRSYVVPDVEFARFRTYAWGPAAALPTGDARLDNNRFFDDRVRERIDNELGRRGLEKQAPGAEPDVVVHYHFSLTQKIDVRTIDRSYAPHSDADAPAATVYDVGTLLIDVIDNRTKTLVWRGWAEGQLADVADDQRLLEARIDEVVTHILRRWSTE